MAAAVSALKTIGSKIMPADNNSRTLLWANFALILSVTFGCGILYNRVANVEESLHKVEQLQEIGPQIQDLKVQVNHLQDRFDRYFDGDKK
jgi:hypothetical protein